MGHKRTHAPQQKQRAFSPLDRHEVGHRPADWGVISFTTFGGSRGVEFITEPKPKYGETRCYIRDPDGYIIEVGQSNPGVTYG
jgi:catechol 2,3-dioxygenase-like lactoylglutathione lyase family enzyme